MEGVMRNFLEVYSFRDRRLFSHFRNPDNKNITTCCLVIDGTFSIAEEKEDVDCPICPEYFSIRDRLTAWRNQGIEFSGNAEEIFGD